MMQPWKITLAGAVGGALLAIAIVFAAAATGVLPVSGPQLRAYMLAHPQLVAEMTDRLQAMQDAAQQKAQGAAMKKIGLAAFFDPKIAFVTGPADAKKTLVEFYDYDCPYCRASIPAVMKYYQAHKNDTRFAFIELPIPSLHGHSAVVAARVSLAARHQPDKYLALHFALMSQQHAVDEQAVYDVAASVGLNMDKLKADMQKPEIDATIKASHALAERASIDGTPTFIINGEIHPGMVDDETLAELTKG
jgi:protein-disulfide isomerase